jgi:hypothetical protein
MKRHTSQRMYRNCHDDPTDEGDTMRCVKNCPLMLMFWMREHHIPCTQASPMPNRWPMRTEAR